MSDHGSSSARSDGAAKSQLQPECHIPGPWRVDPYSPTRVEAPDAPKGSMFIAEARGWGHLTGHGHGALALPEDVARRIQDANARLIAAAPDLLEALKRSAEGWANAIELGLIPKQHVGSATILRDEARAAIAKATSPADTASPSAATDRTS